MRSFWMPIVWLAWCLWPSSCGAQAQPADQPAVDVLHYHLDLDLRGMFRQHLAATATLEIACAAWPDTLALELRALAVSGIQVNGLNAGHVHVGDSLKIGIPKSRQSGLLRGMPFNFTVAVAYAGTPVAPSSFGGFYFQDSIAYNLGVLIDGAPPSFGKCWFPCRDNFTDKATYSCRILTPQGFTGVSNGVLVSGRQTAQGGVFEWKLNQPIPTYLASVAVGRYARIDDFRHCEGTRGIPISMYVRPQDTAAARHSFKNLICGLNHFEQLFGPYGWDRVGYVSVPMRGGAMEHATNIAYPHKATEAASQAFDNLWAHELSHSWFGNLVTCASPEEMWLNEGWARYCESLYEEGVNGPAAFAASVLALQRRSVLGTHLREGWLPVAPALATNIYSGTTYDRGGLMVHALRNFIGDSLFFPSLRSYFHAHKYGNMDTDGFRRYLEAQTGMNLEPFFKFWVYSPGWLSLQAGHAQNTGNVTSSFYLFARHFHTTEPNAVASVAFRAFGPDAGDVADYLIRDSVLRHGAAMQIPVPVTDFYPSFIVLDPENRIPDASIDLLRLVSQPSPITLPELAAVFEVVALDRPFWLSLRNHLAPTTEPAPNRLPRSWELNYAREAAPRGTLRLQLPPQQSAFMKPAPPNATLRVVFRRDPSLAFEPLPGPTLAVGPEGAMTATVENPEPGEYTVEYE